MSEPAIDIKGLNKSFSAKRSSPLKQVLTGVDLSVPAGQVYALLGPNGAGKTTMVNILATLLEPDAGTVKIFGRDVVRDAASVRSLIGVTGQFSAVDALLTGRENLEMMAAFTHIPKPEQTQRVDELLERFDLVDAAKKVASTYSGGMRRRLDLAMTLIARPKLVFLDEPTTGLDPRSRKTMWDIVGELVAEEVTIFLTTQYLDEADALASRIAVLDNGHIVAEGTPGDLKRQIPGGHVHLEFATTNDLSVASSMWPEAVVEAEIRGLDIPGDGSVAHIKSILTGLEQESIEPSDLRISIPNLDDVFFALTGHRTEVGDPSRSTETAGHRTNKENAQ